MRFPGFIGPSYTLQSPNQDAQRCINLYPEINEIGTGKEREIAALIATPGLRLLNDLGNGPVRATYRASDGTFYSVIRNKLYSFDESWTETELGTLLTSLSNVSIIDNGTYLVLVDGLYGYVLTIDGATFERITDEDFPGATQVTYQDGYFIFTHPNTQQFFWADLDGVTFDALSFQSATSSPDQLKAIISDKKNIYALGDRSLEIFYNDGTETVFTRVQGASSALGTAAPFSLAILNGAVYFLGQDENGKGIIYRTQGYQPSRISTHAIEVVIGALGDVSKARAYTYQQGGHSFYCLNLPGAESTWVFDVTTNLWHERTWLHQGREYRHRADCHAFVYDTNVVGDYQSGKIYALDIESDDDGTEILRTRSAPHISKDGTKVAHLRFQLDMETGVGTSDSPDPQAVLQWSDDGGRSWSAERWATIGPSGARKTRAIWNRLGSAIDRVYRIKVSERIRVTILGADLQLEEGLV